MKQTDHKTILVVDDEFDIISVLEKRLTTEHYEVITARNGNDAIAFAKLYHPDLVILDVGLVDMHGGEVLLKIRESAYLKETPFIIISGLYSKSDQIEKKRIFGAEALFAKPYEIEDVLETIGVLLRRSEISVGADQK